MNRRHKQKEWSSLLFMRCSAATLLACLVLSQGATAEVLKYSEARRVGESTVSVLITGDLIVIITQPEIVTRGPSVQDIQIVSPEPPSANSVEVRLFGSDGKIVHTSPPQPDVVGTAGAGSVQWNIKFLIPSADVDALDRVEVTYKGSKLESKLFAYEPPKPPPAPRLGPVAIGFSRSQVEAELGKPDSVVPTSGAFASEIRYTGLTIWLDDRENVVQLRSESPNYCFSDNVCPGATAASVLAIIGSPQEGATLRNGRNTYLPLSRVEEFCRAVVTLEKDLVSAVEMNCSTRKSSR